MSGRGGRVESVSLGGKPTRANGSKSALSCDQPSERSGLGVLQRFSWLPILSRGHGAVPNEAILVKSEFAIVQHWGLCLQQQARPEPNFWENQEINRSQNIHRRRP